MEWNTTESFWEKELCDSKLPDERFRKNLVQMCISLERKPGLSFSSACGPNIRKSAHRLFSKEESIDIQSGHRKSTIERSKEESLILVCEDTTDLNYHGHQKTEGLGNLGGRYPVSGLNMHTAMVVSEKGQPLGLIGQHIWAPSVREGKKKNYNKIPIEEKESYKWIRTKNWVKEHFETPKQKVLIIGDREADFYEHFKYPRSNHIDLLVRARYLNRKVEYCGRSMKLSQVANEAKKLGELEVEVQRQKNRKARKATLSITRAAIKIKSSKPKEAGEVDLYLIHIKEEDQRVSDPIDWYLLYSGQITGLNQACEMVKHYKTRWLIERFHYVLKSGMKIEALQFDNFTRLKHALQVCSLIAWKTMWTSNIAKVEPEKAAIKYFDKIEIEILENYTNKKISTTKDYILGLGTLSGFVKSKKQPLPGEKLIWQAIKLLKAIKIGFLMSQKDTGHD